MAEWEPDEAQGEPCGDRAKVMIEVDPEDVRALRVELLHHLHHTHPVMMMVEAWVAALPAPEFEPDEALVTAKMYANGWRDEWLPSPHSGYGPFRSRTIFGLKRDHAAGVRFAPTVEPGT